MFGYNSLLAHAVRLIALYLKSAVERDLLDKANGGLNI